jgi:ABC-type transport system involved in multi-copper enzyme maturation permease subunit
MLEKGNIDILLSKPVSRSKIILGKFSGGVILIFISLVYLLGAIWIIISIKTGFWHVPFLYSIFWLTLSFAIIYSIVIILGLTTQSSVLTIIINIFLVFVILPVLGARETTIFTFVNSDVIRFIVNFFYYILPKPSDINIIMGNIVNGKPVESYQPVYTSLLFMITMLSLSIWYFKKKDY